LNFCNVPFMMTSPLPGLLQQIERSGSGSVEFWKRLWCEIDALSEMELRRLIMAVGMRGGSIRLMIARRMAERDPAAADPAAAEPAAPGDQVRSPIR
jgi:hypothetical protein